MMLRGRHGAIARAVGLHAATPQVDIIDADGPGIDITSQRLRTRRIPTACPASG